MEKNSVRQDEVSKNKTSKWETIIRISTIVLIVILAILLLHTCGENKRTRAAWNTEADSLKGKIAVLEGENDSLKQDTTSLGIALDLQKYSAWKWELLASFWKDAYLQANHENEELRSPKAVIMTDDSTNTEETGKLYRAFIVPRSYAGGQQSIFVADPKPVQFTVGDSLKLSFLESLGKDMPMLPVKDFSFYKSQQLSDLYGYKKSGNQGSCVILKTENKNRVVMTWTNYIYREDPSKIRRARNFKIASEVLNLGSMVSMHLIGTANPLIKVKHNGLGFDDPNNSFNGLNAGSDRATRNRDIGRVATWGAWGLGKVFDGVSTKNSNEARYYVPITSSVIINF